MNTETKIERKGGRLIGTGTCRQSIQIEVDENGKEKITWRIDILTLDPIGDATVENRK